MYVVVTVQILLSYLIYKLNNILHMQMLLLAFSIWLGPRILKSFSKLPQLCNEILPLYISSFTRQSLHLSPSDKFILLFIVA